MSAMSRNELELAIVATQLDGIMSKIATRSYAQLQAFLRESQIQWGALELQYQEMRELIAEVGELFERRPAGDVSVTPEPTRASLPNRWSRGR